MMKNKITRYLIVVLCVIAILFALVKILTSNKKLDTYLAIGDYLSVSGDLRGEQIVSFTSLLGDYFVSKEMVSNINSNYTSSSVTSSLLLEMINKDSYNGEDEGLVSLISKSKYITISVGMNDILQYVRFDSNNKEMIYDEDVIERKLEIMKQNYYEIVDEIQNINDQVSIYLVGYYCPFGGDNEESNKVFNLLNDSIRDVSELMNVNYVDISDVGKEENLVNKYQIYLNNLGHEMVFFNIKEAYFVSND